MKEMGSIGVISFEDKLEEGAVTLGLHPDYCHYHVALTKNRQPRKRLEVVDYSQKAVTLKIRSLP